MSVRSKSPRRRLGAVLANSRELVRVVYGDPQHVCERLTLLGVQRLAEPSREWAREVRQARSEAPVAELADELRRQSAKIARIDGAVAGTPFYVALVPGYLNYLWQEMRMTLRLAALYGRDPRDLRTSAELLRLRGVHPTVDAAQASLIAVRDGVVPTRPDGRRPIALWVDSIRRLLVFGGFLSPPKGKRPGRFGARLRLVAGLVVGAAGWVITSILPLTLMILMAWGCDSHTRQLSRDAMALYSGEASGRKGARETVRGLRERSHGARALIAAAAVALSIAIPIAFIAYADRVRNTVGINGLSSLGVLVALSLVVATAVLGSRR
jgi:hypothetical protein